MSEDFTEGYKVLWGMAIPKARAVPDIKIILFFPPSAEFWLCCSLPYKTFIVEQAVLKSLGWQKGKDIAK